VGALNLGHHHLGGLLSLGELGEASELETDLSHAAELAANNIATSTRAQYAADYRAYVLWSIEHGLPPTLPVTVENAAAWIASMERRGLHTSTIERRSVGLGHIHREHKHPDPTRSTAVKLVLRGIARKHSARPSKKKRPLTAAMIRTALPSLDLRQRAIVLVAFVTGLRRSVLARATWDQIEEVPEGLLLHLGRSKTDQTGVGRLVPILCAKNQKVCPVRALHAARAYNNTHGLGHGRRVDGGERLFGRSHKTFVRVMKLVAKLAGEDPALFGAHSARAGCFTTAADAGLDMREVMDLSGHKSVQTALGYVRHHQARTSPAARAVLASLEAT